MGYSSHEPWPQSITKRWNLQSLQRLYRQRAFGTPVLFNDQDTESTNRNGFLKYLQCERWLCLMHTSLNHVLRRPVNSLERLARVHVPLKYLLHHVHGMNVSFLCNATTCTLICNPSRSSATNLYHSVSDLLDSYIMKINHRQ